MQRQVTLNAEDILNTIILANTGSRNNELFVDFIKTIFGQKLLSLLLNELRKLLVEVISNELADLKINCDTNNNETVFTLIFSKFNGKNISDGEFIKTELVMIRRVKRIIETIDFKLCFEGWSKKLFEDYQIAIEDYQIATEAFKEQPSKEDLIIHCLVYLFDNESIEIEKEMLK